jgi:hypothetical protein
MTMKDTTPTIGVLDVDGRMRQESESVVVESPPVGYSSPL